MTKTTKQRIDKNWELYDRIWTLLVDLPHDAGWSSARVSTIYKGLFDQSCWRIPDFALWARERFGAKTYFDLRDELIGKREKEEVEEAAAVEVAE